MQYTLKDLNKELSKGPCKIKFRINNFNKDDLFELYGICFSYQISNGWDTCSAMVGKNENLKIDLIAAITLFIDENAHLVIDYLSKPLSSEEFTTILQDFTLRRITFDDRIKSLNRYEQIWS